MKTRILQKNFQTYFLLARLLHLVRILATLDYIWGSKGPKTSQKGPLDLESVRKTFDLTTANALLMKAETYGDYISS